MMESKSRLRSLGQAFLFAVLIHFSASAAPADDSPTGDAIVVEDGAAAEDQSGSSTFKPAQIGASVLDVVLLRPLGVGASAVGLGFFAVSIPFAVPTLDFKTSWDIFVIGPVEYTFVRPIGTI